MNMNDYIEQYNEVLDEAGDIIIGNLTFSPSRVLKEMDPIAYDTGFYDYLDSIGVDSDTIED